MLTDSGVPAGLVGVEWTLTEVRRAGALVAAGRRLTREAVLRFGADGRLSGSDGCNFIGGRAEFTGTTYTLAGLGSTMMLCRGIQDYTAAVRSGLVGQVTCHLGDGVLNLTSMSEVSLRYVRRAGVFPTDRPGNEPPDVVLEDTSGPATFRLSSAVAGNRVMLSMEFRDGPDQGWSYWGITMYSDFTGLQPDAMASANAYLAGKRFLAGLITCDVARVVFRNIDGSEVELAMYPIDRTSAILAYFGFVGDPERGGSLIAYDTRQQQLDAPHSPYWWVDGDPI